MPQPLSLEELPESEQKFVSWLMVNHPDIAREKYGAEWVYTDAKTPKEQDADYDRLIFQFLEGQEKVKRLEEEQARLRKRQKELDESWVAHPVDALMRGMQSIVDMIPKPDYPKTTVFVPAPKKKSYEVTLDEVKYGVNGKGLDPMKKLELDFLEQNKKKEEDEKYWDYEYKKTRRK